MLWMICRLINGVRLDVWVEPALLYYFRFQFNPQKIGVLTNVVGAISECAKTDANVTSIRVSTVEIPDH